MNHSLRQKLVLRTVLAVATVQVLSGVVVNLFVTDGLRDRFDRRLLGRAELLTAEVEILPDGITTDLEEFDPANLPDGAEQRFLQVRDDAGNLHYLSTARRGIALPAPDPAVGEAIYTTLVLEDGRRFRCVHVGFHPETDGEDADPGSLPVPRDSTTTLVLTLARDSASLERDLGYFRLLLILGIAATMLILLVALLALIRATLSPVETLATRISEMDPGRPEMITLDVDVPADFQPIVTRLDELLNKARRAVEREQTFTADFAHEMRTPVAGLRSTLEVALTRERSKDEYSRILTECLGMSKGLHRLTETMLMLRRLESGSAQPGTESFPVRELVQTVADTLKQTAGIKGMNIKTDFEPGLVLRTDQPLMELAVRNLLENAVAHGDAGSDIIAKGIRTGDSLRIEFRNAGGPETQQGAVALRDRFRRGDRSRETVQGHYGLGLALVDAIGQVLGFRMDIRIEVPGIFVVTLRFANGSHEAVAGTRTPAGSPGSWFRSP